MIKVYDRILRIFEKIDTQKIKEIGRPEKIFQQGKENAI